jgi:hypothetical protein
MHAVHVSPYVGTWYPDCRTDLERLLDDLFETSAQRTGAYLFAEPAGVRGAACRTCNIPAR